MEEDNKQNVVSLSTTSHEKFANSQASCTTLLDDATQPVQSQLANRKGLLNARRNGPIDARGKKCCLQFKSWRSQSPTSGPSHNARTFQTQPRLDLARKTEFVQYGFRYSTPGISRATISIKYSFLRLITVVVVSYGMSGVTSGMISFSSSLFNPRVTLCKKVSSMG